MPADDELPDTEEIPFDEVLRLTADMRPPRSTLPSAPLYDWEADEAPSVEPPDDWWEMIERMLGLTIRFVFYVVVFAMVVVAALAGFFVAVQWLTTEIANNS